MFRIWRLIILFLLPIFSVQATNGYFTHGYSLAQKAMGGAGTAWPADSMIAPINPAGVYWAGDDFSLSLSMFTPIRDYTATARGEEANNGIVRIGEADTVRSHNEYFPIPGLTFARRINEQMSYGVSVYANGGMNTEYLGNKAIFAEGFVGMETECEGSFGGGQIISGDDPMGFCGEVRSRSGVDMAIMFVAPSLSIRIFENSSIGIEPVFALNRFAAQGLSAFARFSNSPDKVSDKGHDLSYGAGYRLGLLLGPTSFLNIGLSYQSRIWMSEFDDYAGLFAEQGDFDIPETWNVGLALRATENQVFLFDYQRIYYGDITSVGRPMDPNEFVNNCAIPRLFGDDSPSDACLGSATGPGFGWQDMSIYKFGYQYRHGDFRWRLGYSTTRQPIREDQVLFNVLAPGVVEDHYTAGLSWEMRSGFSLDAAFMYAPNRPVRGKNPLSNTNADLLALGAGGLGLGELSGNGEAFGPDENDQDLILDMRQYELTIGLSWRY